MQNFIEIGKKWIRYGQKRIPMYIVQAYAQNWNETKFILSI